MTEHADVIVVGMGPGGEDAAERLADAGLDVVGVDAELVGGECPYWGCVPSKMMIWAADLLAEARRVPGMAGEDTVHPDWAPVAQRIREEATDDWDDAVAAKRFEDKDGRLVRGWGRLEGPHRVAIDDQVIEAARAVVIGIGTRAWIPPLAGLADTPYWTNRQAIEAEEVPASLAVIGGGPSGSSWLRSSRASAPRWPCSRPVPVWWDPRSQKPAGCWRRSSSPRASSSGPRRPSSRFITTVGAFRSAWAVANQWLPTSCWWPPGAAPICPGSTSPPSASTTRRGPCRWTAAVKDLLGE